MARFDVVGAKTLLIMVGLALFSAAIATLLVMGAMIGINKEGTPLIGSDRWFMFYMIPIIFFTLVITTYFYRAAAQEKITFNY